MVHIPPADCHFGNTKPLHILRGRLGGRMRISEVDFAEPISLVMQAVPEFPGCAPPGANPDAVWNPDELLKSVRRPGAYQLFTCTCGVATDAGIRGVVHVSHPDPDHVVWEMDASKMSAVLDPILASEPDGFLRWIFERGDYENGVRGLLKTLQAGVRTPWPVRSLPDDVRSIACVRSDYPHIDALSVRWLQPDDMDLDVDRLLAMDTDAIWTPEPLWPAGTRIDIGFFPGHLGHSLFRIDSQGAGDWYRLQAFLTRWQLEAELEHWLRHVERAHRRPGAAAEVDQNAYILRLNADLEACHAAGRAFADTLAASLREGRTAPGVEVRYVERALFGTE